jgi:hypothetical protein
MSRNLTATDARPLAGTTFGEGDLYKSVFGGSNAPVTESTLEWRPEYEEGVRVEQPVLTAESERDVHISTLEDSNQNYMKDFLNLIEDVEFGSDDSTKALSALLDTVQSYSILGNSQNSGMLNKAADVLRIIEERAERLFGKTSFWDDLQELLRREDRELERRTDAALNGVQNLKALREEQERERKDRYGLSQNDYQDLADDFETQDGRDRFAAFLRNKYAHLTQEQRDQIQRDAALLARAKSPNATAADIAAANALPPERTAPAHDALGAYNITMNQRANNSRFSRNVAAPMGDVNSVHALSPSDRAQAGRDGGEFASIRNDLSGTFANAASRQVNDVAIRTLGEPAYNGAKQVTGLETRILGEPAYNGAQQVTGLEIRILGEPAYNGLELNNVINEPSVSSVSFAATEATASSTSAPAMAQAPVPKVQSVSFG